MHTDRDRTDTRAFARVLCLVDAVAVVGFVSSLQRRNHMWMIVSGNAIIIIASLHIRKCMKFRGGQYGFGMVRFVVFRELSYAIYAIQQKGNVSETRLELDASRCRCHRHQPDSTPLNCSTLLLLLHHSLVVHDMNMKTRIFFLCHAMSFMSVAIAVDATAVGL